MGAKEKSNSVFDIVKMSCWWCKAFIFKMSKLSTKERKEEKVKIIQLASHKVLVKIPKNVCI